MNATAEATGVGRMLRRWRAERRISQLDLANQAEVSTRHLSFIETGRSKPSRQMVLVLSSALEVPLRERNSLLMAAGYAPAYRETALDAPEIRTILVEHHLPWGPYGAKGLGDAPIAAVAPAVTAAIAHAGGVRLDEIPATPERVFAALRRKAAE